MDPHRRRPPRPLVAGAAVVLALGLLVMLWPVLTNPIVADDRYWYLEAAGNSDGSYSRIVTMRFEDLDSNARMVGRVVAMAYVMRSLSMLLVTDLAVWSATPLVAGQALLKLALLGLILGAFAAFLRSLRHRRPDGSLARLSWPTVGAVLLVATALTGAGAQAHGQFRNGWTAYAVLTWGAALVIVGTIVLLLWCTRLAARHGWLATAAGVVLAVLAGVFLNISYELFYVAVPLILVVLVQQPLLDEDTDPDGRRSRRARLWVGGAFVVSFTALFLVIRRWLAVMCSDRWCYEGSELVLDQQTLVTAVRNFLTAVPGAARSELAADLREQGMADQIPGWATPASVLVAGLAALALVVLVRALDASRDAARRREEAHLLLLAALVPAAAAVGTAVIMALSSLSAEIVVSVGSPYRSTMVTWTMLAFTGAMAVVAVQLLRPRSLGPTLAAAVVVALLAAHTIAGNYPALRASRVDPDNQAVSAVHDEVVLGDPSPEADERRCRTLATASTEIGARLVRERVLEGAESAFRHYHGGPYCSDPPPVDDDD